MASTIEEFDRFAEFMRRTAADQRDVPSLEGCLRLRREEQELAEAIADIQAALSEIEAGNLTSLEEADRIIRAELGWPPPKT